VICSKKKMIRKAAHAESWYSSDGKVLASQLDGWMDAAIEDLSEEGKVGKARAVIAPHAGYRYSGRTAGYSYAVLRKNKEGIKRVYVFGPSHHVYSNSCLLTLADWLETPLGRLRVDRVEVERLLQFEHFKKWSSLEEDEDEHSVEMQLPYLYRIFGAVPGFMVVPITVGDLSFAKEAEVGKFFTSIVSDPSNAIVISSDFCHWGSRFRYQYVLNKDCQLHQSIEQLDKIGMQIIESKDHAAFSGYLKTHKNTICGRHPIGVLLGIISTHPDFDKFMVSFIHYEQSSPCKSIEDSSVSYAAGIIALK